MYLLPPQAVVDVIGSGEIIKWANLLGNNACFCLNAGFTDPYTYAPTVLIMVMKDCFHYNKELIR